MKTIAAKMYDFMLAVPFGDDIAKDYYGGVNEEYETDYRKVRRAQQDCAVLIGELTPISDEEILAALPSAFSGRLAYDGNEFEYTAGQFYDIEVPQAVQAVLEEIRRNRARS